MGLVNKPPAEFALSGKPLMQFSLCSETHVLGDPSPPASAEMFKFDGAEIWHQQDSLLISWIILHPWIELISFIIKTWMQYFLKKMYLIQK